MPALSSLLIELDPTRPKLRRELRPGQLAWYAGASVLWVAVFYLTSGQSFVTRVAAGLMVIGLVVVGSYYRRRAGFRNGLKDVRRVMLQGSLCPSCTHSLVGLPEHDDGCNVCPECGSAWRKEPTQEALTHVSPRA
ncbi:MAG: hypothetical protein SFZ23_03095 [Planctomycetota bacterium]|nr:hypothetical protein [Planctomycetota bacterium]